ncbi:hypothetical protein MHYP_G00086850 [Metynnis hypsauchen]
MEANDIIQKVSQPTEWCAPMVPAPKKSGKVRICADLKRLNKAVKRERFILPTAEEIIAGLSGSTVFSSLDATAGFWQIPLDKDSQRLTTFIMPFARYCFKRLPFGITSAPEIFQRKMVETLEGLQGVSVYMDDIIIHGKDMTEHDERLQRVLERLESAGLKLNAEKCVLRQRKLHFLGQVIDADGVQPDPAKVLAINNFLPPENVQELKRVLGLVNYLGKYILNLATVGQPLYELLKSNSVWTWGPAQMSAFQHIKEQLTMSPTLKYYDINKPTAVPADASSYGIGAVLMQLHGQDWRAVAYCSRRLSVAETRYQRLLMRLMRFNPTAEYAPGKTLVIADTLSRSPCKDTQSDKNTHRDVECYVASVIEGIPATKQKIDSIRAATEADEGMQILSRRAQSREPLLSTPLPDRPWKRIGVDLCEHKKQNYLVVSDYYSRYIEILHMPVTTSAQVVKLLKATFARYGIPKEVVSDNGPQFTSLEFKELARELDFTHITSSPHNPQGNGHAERAVQTAKGILYQKDPLLALMCYRATPCNSTGASPAEILMGPKWPSRKSIKARDTLEKQK